MKNAGNIYINPLSADSFMNLIRMHNVVRIGDDRIWKSIPLEKIKADAKFSFRHWSSNHSACLEKVYTSCYLSAMLKHLVKSLRAKGAVEIDMTIDEQDRLIFSFEKVPGLSSIQHKYTDEKQTRHEIIAECADQLSKVFKKIRRKEA